MNEVNRAQSWATTKIVIFFPRIVFSFCCCCLQLMSSQWLFWHLTELYFCIWMTHGSFIIEKGEKKEIEDGKIPQSTFTTVDSQSKSFSSSVKLFTDSASAWGYPHGCISLLTMLCLAQRWRERDFEEISYLCDFLLEKKKCFQKGFSI